MVRFESIEIENFLSIEYARLEFQDGLYAVIGVNRDKGGSNGAGKSALWEALKWVLDDNLFRDPEKKDDIIRRGARWVRVVVAFRRGGDLISVSRSRRHPKDGTGVRVRVNGQLPLEERHSNPAGLITELLGMGSSAFVATTFFGHRMPSFITLRDADRKQLLLRASGTTFDVTAKRITEFARTVRQRVHGIHAELALLTSEERPQDPGSAPSLSEEPLELETIQRTLESQLDGQDRELSTCNESLRILRGELERKTTLLSSLLEGHHCPTCGSDKSPPAELLETHLQTLEGYQNQILSLESSLPVLRGKLDSIKDELNSIRECAREARGEYIRSKERYVRWQADVRKYKESTTRAKIEDVQRKLVLAQAVSSDLEDLGETYSASGFPAWEVAHLLPDFNEELRWILEELTDIDVEVILNDKGSLQLKIPESQLGLLSGGEGQVVDFAVNLAGALVARRRYEPTNIFVIDEGAWAVDGQGVERLVQFLTLLLQRVPSIYVISHRQDMLALPRRLTATKSGGKTTYADT